ncbi:LacI family DNA-binding transcriptional regulator [Amycolatopsis alkalitolerans]|uniref:LacI family transcriptional regulator n=1 Tax=Amycolatopsis alkalitolerans TaxID=2547244 RepID=A0A5C4LTJ9_9PSEU|nr:LacI family DNA-binding transcriptional regulator [Amycolatopsis alkalitolerans]TNC22409.1 LacI family transcriptional regulator [Amycolatopsis alkalitolerans]
MVADAAGVSLPTASKVLNGRGDVSDATRARVEEALREFGYIPQTGRRTVAPSRVVDLVFDDLRSTYSLEILRGVTEAGAEIGVDVVVGRVPEPAGTGPFTPEDSWAQRLKSSGREGLIVVTSELSLAQVEGFGRAGLSLVVIDPLNLPRVEVTSVGATNWSGGLTAAEHLLSLGHRRIAYAGGPPGASCSQARLHGYRAALENAGCVADPDLVLHGGFEYGDGLEMGTRLLAADNPPTAIFAGNDAAALGVMEAARRRGLRVPEDLSVIGFDDTVLAERATPALTTVRQPLQDMGRVALRTLLRLADGESLDSHHVELATNLVVRGSTAPISEQGAR